MGRELHTVVDVVHVAAWHMEVLLRLAVLVERLVYIISHNIRVCQASH